MSSRTRRWLGQARSGVSACRARAVVFFVLVEPKSGRARCSIGLTLSPQIPQLNRINAPADISSRRASIRCLGLQHEHRSPISRGRRSSLRRIRVLPVCPLGSECMVLVLHEHLRVPAATLRRHCPLDGISYGGFLSLVRLRIFAVVFDFPRVLVVYDEILVDWHGIGLSFCSFLE